MANIASVLRTEIARVARKEVRSEIESLKKASTQHRAAIAQLRRQVLELQRELGRAKRGAAIAAKVEPSADVARRFSAKRLAAHRSKLGLSAAAYGKLVDMSGATIYLWEQGRSRPNPEQLQRLAFARTLSKKSAQERLSGV